MQRCTAERASITTSAMVNSATLRVLLNGALKTATPERLAESSSTWSVPMQKQPIARSCGAELRIRALTLVFDLIPRM